jgi:tRNA A37 threonylcarbamoyladenosine dehydratase
VSRIGVALARAGVGKLVLVDKEALKSANVGRHPLGVESVGDPKAAALARQIQSALPHVEVIRLAAGISASRACAVRDTQ